MGLLITPVTFYPFTTVASADMNSNFTVVQNASKFQGAWNASNNAAVQIQNVDTTDSQGNAIFLLEPGTGNANRGISIAQNISGTVTDVFYIDPATGYGHVVNHWLLAGVSNTNNWARIQSGAFFTGTGSGTYSHGSVTTPLYMMQTNHGVSSAQQISADTPGSTTVAIHNGGAAFWACAMTGA